MLADQGMLTPHETEIEQLNLNNVIRELEAIKANNGGKMPYGTISKVVEARKDCSHGYQLTMSSTR